MKLNKLIYAALVAVSLSSCGDKMDYNEYSVYDEDFIRTTFARAGGVLTSAYNDLDYDFGGNYNGALLASATDESVYSHSGNAIETFYNGGWGPANNNDASLWTKCWRGISYANLFLDKFNGLTFDDYLTDLNYKAEMHQYNNFQFEARFLRAYYYFLLVRSFGGVPLKVNDMDAETANNLPRNTADEVFQFIDAECVAIKDTIIKDYSDLGDMALSTNETGRVNNLAVLALRARAALYHASPLFAKDKSTEEQKELWKKAAEANLAVIKECTSRGMKLNSNYSALFDADNWKETNECIFVRRVATLSNSFETYNFPIGLENAGGGNCPTQNLVDAYETTDGKAIDDPTNTLYDPNNPYANRDARLGLTVAVNGENWPNNTLETYYGGVNGPQITYGTPTGYYLKKYVNKSLTIGGSSPTTGRHHWVIFRLGEFYLNYAEAMLNWQEDGYTKPSGFSMTAAEAINYVRKRAKQPDIATGLNFDEFKKRYENERFVELAFEGHRFYDVRRWMEGSVYFTTIRKMNITKNADGTFNYEPEEILPKRNWEDKMNLFPISQSEVMKSGALTQNPGW